MVHVNQQQQQHRVEYEPEGGIRNPACSCQDDETGSGTGIGQDTSDGRHNSSSQQRLSATALKLVQQQQQQEKPSTNSKKTNNNLQERRSWRTVCRNHLRELKKIMTVSSYPRVQPWRLSPNLFVGAFSLLIMLLSLTGRLPNQTIGFYCEDPKISHKFTGDTITVPWLFGTTLLVPLILIYAVEWSYYSPESYRSLEGAASSSSIESGSTTSGSGSNNQSSTRSRQLWKWYGYYTLGWYYLIFVVEVLKMLVGEPRPHFLDSCRPANLHNCTPGSYQQSYECTNRDLSRFYVLDSDKSFPSGHAALSMFTATFLTWYLHSRMPNRLSVVLVKPWLQCSMLIWGLGCGMSRVIDHRHHWWDVGIGYILGLLFGIFVVRVLCRSFRPNQPHNHHHNNKKNLAAMSVVANGTKHQSVKKLLSTSSSIEEQDSGRELPVWSNP